ncbi:MAG: PKD domain-containing protein, partial [Halobacteriales archaeon]
MTNTDNDSRQIWATYSNQEAISFYVESSDNADIIGEDLANNVTLGPNQSMVVSMRVDTTGKNTKVGDTLITDLYIGDKEAEVPAEAVITGPDAVDEGSTIDLSGEDSTGTGDELTYSWRIVDGVEGGQLTPTDTASTTYEAPSDLTENQTVTIELTVTDKDGETNTVTKTISVIGNVPPTASITGPNQVDAGKRIRFDARGSSDPDGEIDRYAWSIDGDVGELLSSTGPRPRFEAPSDLTKNATVTIELTVTDNAGATTTVSKKIKLIANRPPSADAGGPYRTGSEESIPLDGASIVDPDGEIETYNWTIISGGGSLNDADTQTPEFTAPTVTDGNRTVEVRLTVTDDSGATATTTTTITVTPNAPPRAEFGGPYTVAPNESIEIGDTDFDDADGEITDRAWEIVDGPGSLSDTDSDTPTYTAPADITENTTVTIGVTLTDDNGATITKTTNITIVPLQPPTADAGGPYSVPSDGELILDSGNFTDPNGEIEEYDWRIVPTDDGTTLGELDDTDSPTPTYQAPTVTENTTVTVKVTVTDDEGATTTAETTITVTPTNQPPIVNPGGPYTVQTGNQLAIDEINATDPDGNITDYSWEIVSGDGSLDNTDSATPTYTAPDSLTSNATVLVNVTVTDDDGGTTTRTIEIGVFRPNTNPDIQVSRSTITYPDIGKGLNVSGAEYTVTITNNGTAPLMINRTSIVGDGSDQFQIVTDLPDRMMLGVGKSRTVEVKFAPTQAGGFEPDLQFKTNDPDEPIRTVGLQATALPPLIDIEKDTLDFGNISVSGSKTLNLTVSNPGDSPADLHIRTTTIVGKNPGDFEIIGGSAPFTLAPGESRDVQVRYSPQTSGLRTAQLRIRSDARNSQIDVWLSNSDWWVRVEDMQTSSSQTSGGDQSESGGSDTGGGSTTEANGAQITGNNVPPGVGLAVNTSVPSVEDEQAFVQKATVVPNTKVGTAADFNINFLHDEEKPPTADGERINVTANRSTLEYVTVEHTIANEELANSTMTFRVDKSDLPADVDRDEIRIRHKVDGTWKNMDATLVKESGKTLIYQITTPGFSQFAVTGPNREPTADAGDDVTVQAGGSIQLDASGSSDPDGEIKKYAWEIVDGPGSLFRHDTATPSYTVPESAAGQTATIRLTVTDNSDATATETITVEIGSLTTPPANGTTPGNGTGGGGVGGGAGGVGGGAQTPTTPTGTPTGSGGTGTPAGTPTGEGEADVSGEGVKIDFPGDQQSGEQSLSDVISISDVPLPEDDADRDGPKAKIRPGFTGDAGTQSVATNDSGVSLAVASEDDTQGDLDLKGADALTLVEKPIPLDGTHSLFASKDSIEDNWRMIRQVNISVPEEYEDRSAVLTITVPKSRFGETDPEDATIARQNNGWSLLSTRVVDQSGDTVVLQAETPGFSRFAVFAQNSVSYSWEVETYDEPLTGPTIEPTFDEPGFYNATLTVTDAFGRTDTANFTILANDVPEVEIQWESDTVPTNETVVMSASVQDEVGNITYTWRFPDGTEKTGQTVNHTLPANATGKIVVIAEDEFGAQGRDAITVGGGSGTYSVDVLSYNLQIGQNLLWLLVALLALLGLIAVLRWFGIILGGDDHPPVVEAFEDPEIDLDEQWVVIPELAISDVGEDLDTITTSILLADDELREELQVIGHEEGTFQDGTEYYEGSAVVVSVDPDEQLLPETAYTVEVAVTDEDGTETVAERPVPPAGVDTSVSEADTPTAGATEELAGGHIEGDVKEEAAGTTTGTESAPSNIRDRLAAMGQQLATAVGLTRLKGLLTSTPAPQIDQFTIPIADFDNRRVEIPELAVIGDETKISAIDIAVYPDSDAPDAEHPVGERLIELDGEATYRDTAITVDVETADRFTPDRSYVVRVTVADTDNHIIAEQQSAITATEEPSDAESADISEFEFVEASDDRDEWMFIGEDNGPDVYSSPF